MIIYRAGSLTRAFQPLEKAFTCQTGIQVKDVAMGSVDAGRQITAGGQACDLYAPADYLDIDLFMKPAGYADFNIVFAHGRMVLAYSASGLAAKKLPPIAEPGSPPFHPPASIPKAAAKWYEILTMPGVAIGGGNPFLDPGAYRAPMIFQLAEAYYKVPNLYNNLLEHVVITGSDSGAALGKGFDFQFTYEHNARATAAGNPDYRYVDLPDEINLSDPRRMPITGKTRSWFYLDSGLPERANDCGSGRSCRLGHYLAEGCSEQGERDQIPSAAAEPGRDLGAEKERARSAFSGHRHFGGLSQPSGAATPACTQTRKVIDYYWQKQFSL